MDSIRTRGASGATARLRRTFRYPSDDELSDGLPEAMDEQGLLLSFSPFYLFIIISIITPSISI